MTRTVNDALAAIERDRLASGYITWEVAALRDEVLRLRALTTWQPIETAPKDGMEVITARLIGKRYEIEIDFHDGDLGWLGSSTTHWLPLPEPPQ